MNDSTNFLGNPPLIFSLTLSLCIGVAGCLETDSADFGSGDSPYDYGEGSELTGQESSIGSESNGGIPGQEFTDGGDESGTEPGEGEESGDESGESSGESAGEGSGEESASEGEESGEEGSGEESPGEEGSQTEEAGAEAVEEEGTVEVAGFCEQFEDACGEWATCTTWWENAAAGDAGSEVGANKGCYWTHLSWAQESTDAALIQEYCDAAAGGVPCVEEEIEEAWDPSAYADCTPADQASLAVFATEIFEANCLGCHGVGNAQIDDILDLQGLVDAQLVLPQNPAESKIFKRMNEGTMPPEYSTGPTPSEDDVSKVEQWISCLEPEEAEVVIGLEQFYDLLAIDIMEVKASSRKFIRYISLVHLYNGGATPQQLQTYREGVVKLMNSLTWSDQIQTIAYADPQELVLRLDIRDFEWDSFPLAVPGLEGTNVWTQVANAYPYPTSLEDSSDLEILVIETETPVPVVYGDWFVATASVPPLYHDVLGLPGTLQELEVMLGVNVEDNIALTLTGSSLVARAGMIDSQVSSNNRVVERHFIDTSSDDPGKLVDYEGAFWLSYDFASNSGKQNIVAHPLDFEEDGGEVVFNLPNGLQGYFISDAVGTRLDTAPVAIVADPNGGEQGETIVNGRSCMKCHFAGLNEAEDIIHDLASQGSLYPSAIAGQIQSLFNPSNFSNWFSDDQTTFKEALEEAAVSMVEQDVEEQIWVTGERHLETLSATDVSAHLYMSWEELVSNPGAVRLKSVPELSVLLKTEQGGVLSRSTFNETYNDFLCFLDQGDPINPETGDAGCAIVRVCNGLSFSGDTTIVVNGVELQAPLPGSCSPCRALPVGGTTASIAILENGVQVFSSVVPASDDLFEFTDDDEFIVVIDGTPGNPVIVRQEMIGSSTCEDVQDVL